MHEVLSDKRSICGPLLTKSALCAGFSLIMKMFYDTIGIKAFIISGRVNRNPH